MKFELSILGSGSAVPTPQRNPSAQVLNIQEDYFLIDCAEGTQMQMRRYNIPMQRINNIFISHLHGDHYLGLPGLLQTQHMLGRTKEMVIYGPTEIEDLIRMHLHLSKTTLRYALKFVSVSHTQSELILENAKLEVRSLPLLHKIDTRGYLFREKPKPRNLRPNILNTYNIPVYWRQKIKDGHDFVGEDGELIANHKLTAAAAKPKSYAYCSDTAYNEALIPLIQGVDLLYHEASFLESMKKRAKETMHSTAFQAATIAHKAAVGQLLMGHFSARYPSAEPFLEEAKTIFDNCICAHDGLVINL